MGKTLNITYEGKEYTLEYTRRAVYEMERKGFLISDIYEKPISTLPLFFSGAFVSKHRTLKQETIDKIYSNITNKQELLGKLSEMYNEPIETLMEEPEESEKNATWTANW